MNIGHLILHRFDQNTVDQFYNRCVRSSELIEMVVFNAALDLEIIGCLSNDCAEVIYLRNGEFFFNFFGSGGKK